MDIRVFWPTRGQRMELFSCWELPHWQWDVVMGPITAHPAEFVLWMPCRRLVSLFFSLCFWNHTNFGGSFDLFRSSQVLLWNYWWSVGCEQLARLVIPAFSAGSLSSAESCGSECRSTAESAPELRDSWEDCKEWWQELERWSGSVLCLERCFRNHSAQSLPLMTWI